MRRGGVDGLVFFFFMRSFFHADEEGSLLHASLANERLIEH